jgi:hypothetical protein
VNTVKQGEFRMFAAVPENELLDEKLIEQCATFQQALGVSRAMARRKLADGAIAGHRLVPIAETRAQRLRRELAELEAQEAA